jgi:Zn-dependent protease
VATVSWFFEALFRALGAGPSLISAFAVAGVVASLHAVIHLFPVFPLDGARAAMAWGGPRVRRFVQQLAQFGVLGFVVIFFLLSYTGITGAISGFFRFAIYGSIQALFRAFGA